MTARILKSPKSYGKSELSGVFKYTPRTPLRFNGKGEKAKKSRGEAPECGVSPEDPIPLRSGDVAAWPQVVVEVGTSESQR